MLHVGPSPVPPLTAAAEGGKRFKAKVLTAALVFACHTSHVIVGTCFWSHAPTLSTGTAPTTRDAVGHGAAVGLRLVLGQKCC